MFLANVDCQRGPTNQSDFDIFDQNRLTFIDDHTSKILLVRPLILICVYAAQENGLNFWLIIFFCINLSFWPSWRPDDYVGEIALQTYSFYMRGPVLLPPLLCETKKFPCNFKSPLFVYLSFLVWRRGQAAKKRASFLGSQWVLRDDQRLPPSSRSALPG